MSTKISKKMGRPRDESVRIKILQSVMKLLFEKGHKETTIKDIALEAGVGKQTIYRWWNNKAEILMETLLYYIEKNVNPQEDLRSEETLNHYLTSMFGSFRDEITILLKSMMAESISNKEFLTTFFDTFIKKRQDYLAGFLVNLSQFKDAHINKINLIVDIIFGSMWYRLLFEHRPLDKEFAHSLAEIIWVNEKK